VLDDFMDEVVLDKVSFKALASETRIDLLKRLDKGRRTASQLAEEFSLSVQAVSEHLKRLEEAGLVERKDDGHKWVYFDLTVKSKKILGKEKPSNVLFLLSVSFLMIASGVGMVVFNSLNYTSTVLSQNILENSDAGVDNSLNGLVGQVGVPASELENPLIGQKAMRLPASEEDVPPALPVLEEDVPVASPLVSVRPLVVAASGQNYVQGLGLLETLLIVAGTFLLGFSAKKMFTK
jgi:DNA-binding transcriptional ArsR family regulator